MTDGDERDRNRDLEAAGPMATRTAGLAAGLGAVIFFSGIFFTGTGYVVPNNVVAGVLIGAAGSYAAAVPGGGRIPAILAPVVVLLVGLWVLATPFVFGVTGPLLWSSVVLGGVVAILGAASAYGGWQFSQATAAGA